MKSVHTSPVILPFNVYNITKEPVMAGKENDTDLSWLAAQKLKKYGRLIEIMILN